jgi:hypothetical protein
MNDVTGRTVAGTSYWLVGYGQSEEEEVMTIEDFDAIRAAVEELHGAPATYLSSEHVRESLEGKKVWDGHVAVFGLAGHPAAIKCYGWAAEEPGSTRRTYYAVLHAAPIESSRDAVRASLALKQGTLHLTE